VIDVAQQCKRQVVFFLELRLGVRIVGADTDYSRLLVLEL
jgi:hypothetical protein